MPSGPYSTKALVECADDWVVADGFISLDLMRYEDVVCSADALDNKRDLLLSFLRMVIDEELVLKAAKGCGKIVTCEEHSVIGGAG